MLGDANLKLNVLHDMGSSAKPLSTSQSKRLTTFLHVPYYVTIRSAIRSSKFQHDSHWISYVPSRSVQPSRQKQNAVRKKHYVFITFRHVPDIPLDKIAQNHLKVIRSNTFLAPPPANTAEYNMFVHVPIRSWATVADCHSTLILEGSVRTGLRCPARISITFLHVLAHVPSRSGTRGRLWFWAGAAQASSKHVMFPYVPLSSWTTLNTYAACGDTFYTFRYVPGQPSN